MKDVFEYIHELAMRGYYLEVLKALLTQDCTTIVSPYNTDTNHAWYLVGCAYFKLKNYQNAISAFKRAIEY